MLLNYLRETIQAFGWCLRRYSCKRLHFRHISELFDDLFKFYFQQNFEKAKFFIFLARDTKV